MSRIGKLPIMLPDNVEIDSNGSNFKVTGQFGTLKKTIPDVISILKKDNILNIHLKSETRKDRSLHGLYRTLINNMIIGVSKQFELTLILKGVGYKAIVQNELIILNLGYSHSIEIKIPKEISIEIIQNTSINLKSCDKEMLGLFAANIRRWRQPEPYKGKGVLYKGEKILRKIGKSAK